MEKKRESSQWKGAFNTGVYRNMFAEVGFVEEEIEQRKAGDIPDIVLW